MPKGLENSVLNYRYGNSTYIIEFRAGAKSKITLDGVVTERYITLENGKRSKILVETEKGK